MKGFIEVTPKGGIYPVLVAINSIAILDAHTANNARIVTNVKLQDLGLAEVIICSLSYHFVKGLMQKAISED